MIVAKISSPFIKDRFFQLNPGRSRVGSHLDCDVVLLDEGIRPVHMILHVAEGSVDVEINEGATASFRACASHTLSLLCAGDRLRWKCGDVLEIEGIAIELQGLAPPHAVPDAPCAHRRHLPGRCQPGSVTGAIVAGLVVIGGWHLSGYASRPMADAAEQQVRVSTPVLVAPDWPAIAKQLEAFGLKPADLTYRDGRWAGVLRVPDEDALHLLNSALDGLHLPFEPKIHVDQQLHRAAERVLTNLAAGIHILSVDDGVARLSATSHDPTAMRTIREHLRQDVPGIARVDFVRATASDLTHARAAVAAVWGGDFPYVVLADNSIVRPGNVLWRDIKLLEVKQDHIVVEVDGCNEKIAVP